MFAPPFRRASPSPGPSSVQPWFLFHAVVVGALLALASSSNSNICGADFANQMHTIGPIDGDLWAITKDNWTIYKLTPCNPENDSLSHCMKAGEPVSIDSKWPELAKSVKEAANKTDYNFTFDKSVIGYSLSSEDTVLAMRGTTFHQTGFFAYLFRRNSSITTLSMDVTHPFPYEGSWISSDEKDKVYRILPSLNQSNQIRFVDFESEMEIMSSDSPTQNICSVDTNDSQVLFTTDKCVTAMVFNVSRGVLYDNQFYLFGFDRVYIFLDKTEKTKLVELSYEIFFPCKKPTTLMSLNSNVTKARWTKVTGEHMSTTAKGMKPSTILIYVIIGIIVLLVIAGVGYYLYPKNDIPKKADDKRKGEKPFAQLGGSSGTKANVGFSGKDMSQSNAKVSKVGSSAASMVGGKSSSKIGSKT